MRAERRGLQLAILCRTVVFSVALAWYVVSLIASGDQPNIRSVILMVALVAVGVAHFMVIGTRFDRPVLPYSVLGFDILAIAGLFVFLPVSANTDIPQIFAFRTVSPLVFVPFIALAALSMSPRLVVWSGTVAAAAWLGAFAIVVAGMERTVSWSDIPNNPTLAEYTAFFFSPDFIGRGSRLTEAIALLLVTLILAIAVARSRHVFFAQVNAEAAREAERTARSRITRQLGRFVPPSIAERLIEDPTVLQPKVRHGAVLIMDVVDFTAFASGRDPADVIAALNAFLARAAEEVAAEGGVVISFTGDGLLAAFNTPLPIAAPERAALRAADRLVGCGAAHDFAVRVGVAAGPIAAGSVGSVERQAFTVYGDTVNRAARLEAHCKEIGTAVLVDDGVAHAADRPLWPHGATRLAGFSEPVAIYAPTTGTGGERHARS